MVIASLVTNHGYFIIALLLNVVLREGERCKYNTTTTTSQSSPFEHYVCSVSNPYRAGTYLEGSLPWNFHAHSVATQCPTWLRAQPLYELLYLALTEHRVKQKSKPVEFRQRLSLTYLPSFRRWVVLLSKLHGIPSGIAVSTFVKPAKEAELELTISKVGSKG